MEITIVTGVSGAGKTSALNILEDMGYYSMDNLPPQLIMSFVELSLRANVVIEKLAVGIDIRGASFLNDLNQAIYNLKAAGFSVSMLFLDSSDEVLVKRYKELRRPHPLEKKGNVLEGIRAEREILSEIRKNSNFVLNTSNLTLGKLKERLTEVYNLKDASDKMIISVVSFGYKNGILLDADLVFDVRFLPNPFYISELKELTGKDKEVSDYVMKAEISEVFTEKIIDMVEFAAPYYEKEGKRNLVIAIGCTGGRHRSVAITEELAKRLRKKFKLVFASHRDERFW